MFIKIYIWNFENKCYQVAQVPAFDKFNRSIKYTILNNTVYKFDTEIELKFDDELEKLNKIIDKTNGIIEGHLIPYCYVEFGLSCLTIKTCTSFGVVKQNEFYKLIYKTSNKKINDKAFPIIPEIQAPFYEKDIELYIRNFTINQTLEDVIKENPSEDVEMLKIKFGKFIIKEFKNFVTSILTSEIERMKHEIGIRNNVQHKIIYDIVKRKLPILNKRLEYYNKLSNKNTKFIFNDATRCIEFTKY